MEDELNEKNELIKKQEHLIQEWKKELTDQLDKHNTELNRVQFKILFLASLNI